MLNTVIDYPIFEDFVKNQPKQPPFGTLEENDYWLSFWKFLKEQSNVELVHYSGQQNIFLNDLPRGRKGTTLKLKEKKFNRPQKCTFKKDTNVQTVYFIDEPDDNCRVKYRRNNGFIFGFLKDYPQYWKQLRLLNKRGVIPARLHAKNRLKSWEDISSYIMPFTDMIIADNYMFDISLWKYNLIKLIQIFSSKTPVKFNLLLLSFAEEKRDKNNIIGYKNIDLELKEELRKLNINCNLFIVFATQEIKEHDRGIFTNYLRIKSGTSLNYFDKNNKCLVKTALDFYSLAEPDKYEASHAALKDFMDIINNLRNLKEHEERRERFLCASENKNGLKKKRCEIKNRLLPKE